MKIRSLTGAVTSTALALALTVVVVPLAHADTTTPGSFNTVQSTRILDTRKGLGAAMAPIGAGRSVTVAVTNGIPVPVAAVALEVTAVNPSARGFLTVYAAGAGLPVASVLNFEPAQNVPTMVFVPVSTDGKVTIYNGSAGTVELLADIHGYVRGGVNTGVAGTFVPMTPQRFLDTRIGLGTIKKRASAGSITKFKVAGLHGVPADASAVALNLTAAQPSAVGHASAYPGGPVPAASTLNYQAKQNRANLALVGVGPDGTISVFTYAATDLVVDISGYFVGGVPATDGTFVPSTPFRVFDSRGPGGQPAGALTTSKINVFPANDPTFSVIKAVAVNVVAVTPQANGFLTTWDGVVSLPSVSSSNFRPGENVAGSVVLPVNPDGTISIYNGSFGNTHLVVDVTGLFFALPEITPNKAGTHRFTAAQSLAQLTALHPKPASVPVSVTRR